MYPQDVISKASEELFAQGVRVLQGNRFADSEIEHVKKLIDYMGLTGKEKSVADMGCGFGWVSLMMSVLIPRTKFWLVNTNEFQLDRCPAFEQFTPLLEQMTSTSIPDASVDLVMFNYSMCHVNAWFALIEAGRIARKGGRLFIYDYDRIGGDDALSEVYLYAQFKGNAEFRNICANTGWTDVKTIHPGGDDTVFREAFANDELYDCIFSDLVPVIWKAKRT